MAKYFEKLGEMVADNLIANTDVKAITASGTIASGAGVLVRGTVVATDSNGKLVAMASGKTPYAVLCDDVDATEADAVAEVYLTGRFNKNALVVAEGYTLTAADINTLRNGGIFVEAAV